MQSSSTLFPVALLSAERRGDLSEDVYRLKAGNSPDRTVELALTRLGTREPGVYGAQAAAQHWFGKDAADLSRREAARLAAILPAPRRYQAEAPGPYVRRRAGRIQAAMGTVRNDGLDNCVRLKQAEGR